MVLETVERKEELKEEAREMNSFNLVLIAIMSIFSLLILPKLNKEKLNIIFWIIFILQLVIISFIVVGFLPATKDNSMFGFAGPILLIAILFPINALSLFYSVILLFKKLFRKATYLFVFSILISPYLPGFMWLIDKISKFGGNVK